MLRSYSWKVLQQEHTRSEWSRNLSFGTYQYCGAYFRRVKPLHSTHLSIVELLRGVPLRAVPILLTALIM